MSDAPRATPLWRPAPVPPAAVELEAGGQPRHLASLLARRGVEGAEAAERFLRPSPEDLHDPFLLRGMERAVSRLEQAAREGERVVIVGDYDVDGVSGTALLLAVLRACGLDATAVLPHRLRDGYGFQQAQLDRAVDLGARVVVTVDCGTTSVATVTRALEGGIDVIVTDHHLPDPDFPPAAIQINPRQEGCSYPFQELSGAGLALKLALALGLRIGRQLELAPLLRIACLGTIADIVPLLGENRVISALGLKALEQTQSQGLLALIEEAGVRPPFRADDVGYRLGPRINAAGRLDSPDSALELLLTRKEERAKSLAARLGQLNDRRRAEEEQATEEARELFAARDPLPGILVAWSDRWHRGVVGIAAGRLAREFYRPTLLLAVDGSSATGSGRSIPGISLHGFLSGWRDRLERFGGHDAAVGLTAPTAALEELLEEWERDARWPPDVLQRFYEYELELAAADIDRRLMRDLLQLEPHGASNPTPLVCVRGLLVSSEPRRFGRDHVRVRARAEDGAGLWLLGWSWESRLEELQGGRFDALGTLQWDGFLSEPVLCLEDVRPTGHPGAPLQ